MEHHFFAYINRMKFIQRWGLMRNTMPENDMEHALQTAMIAHAIAVMGNVRHHKSYNAEYIMALAMYHDASEVITGDLPTPIKYHSEDIRDAYKQVESLACRKLLDTLPEALRPAYEELLTGQTQERLYDLVKAADKLSAYVKCIEERKAGNREFLSAEAQTRRILEESPLPEVAYFLEHFIPAFEKNLDELGTIE